MLTIIVSPAGRGKFTAHLQDGRQLCQRTFSPFLAAARQLSSRWQGSQHPDHNAPRREQHRRAREHNRRGGQALRYGETSCSAPLRALSIISNDENECAQLRRKTSLGVPLQRWLKARATCAPQ